MHNSIILILKGQFTTKYLPTSILELAAFSRNMNLLITSLGKLTVNCIFHNFTCLSPTHIYFFSLELHMDIIFSVLRFRCLFWETFCCCWFLNFALQVVLGESATNFCFITMFIFAMTAHKLHWCLMKQWLQAHEIIHSQCVDKENYGEIKVNKIMYQIILISYPSTHAHFFPASLLLVICKQQQSLFWVIHYICSK